MNGINYKHSFARLRNHFHRPGDGQLSGEIEVGSANFTFATHGLEQGSYCLIMEVNGLWLSEKLIVIK